MNDNKVVMLSLVIQIGKVIFEGFSFTNSLVKRGVLSPKAFLFAYSTNISQKGVKHTNVKMTIKTIKTSESQKTQI